VLHPGWTVTLRLYSPAKRFSEPSERGARILRITAASRRGYSSQATYSAVKVGDTVLRAVERPICTPGRACPQFAQLWQVHVHVTA